MALSSPSTAGRLLLLLNSISESETSSSKRAKKKSSYKLGSLVQAEVCVSDSLLQVGIDSYVHDNVRIILFSCNWVLYRNTCGYLKEKTTQELTARNSCGCFILFSCFPDH